MAAFFFFYLMAQWTNKLDSPPEILLCTRFAVGRKSSYFPIITDVHFLMFEPNEADQLVPPLRQWRKQFQHPFDRQSDNTSVRGTSTQLSLRTLRFRHVCSIKIGLALPFGFWHEHTTCSYTTDTELSITGYGEPNTRVRISI